MKKNQARVIALLSTAIFVLAFLISARVWFRLDLTRDKAYTISEVSRNLYREIPDQVMITYFVSERLSLAHPMPGEIADLLREYAAHSHGKIRFAEKDPAKAELIGVVDGLGILPQQMQVVEKNETTVATVYSGILIEYLDRREVIPVVFSLDTLEYDLSSRIRSLVRNVERELGVIVGDANKQWGSDYGYLYQELVLAGFKIRLIAPGEDIPAMLPALFVLGGAEDLDEDRLFGIDRYITGGGNVFFATDGVFVDTSGSLDARPMRDKGLLAMLANYGVVVRQALVLDRTALNLTFRAQTGNSTIIRSIRYPEWIGVQDQRGNPNHLLTKRFGGLDLYWASPLELSPPPGINAEILFSSTEGSWLQEKNFITNPNMVSQFENEAARTTGAKILGAALSGIFPGFINEHSSPETIDDHGRPPPQTKPSRIIVVGDTEFASTFMQVSRGETRNLDFLIKAAEWLSSDDDMLSIRGRENTAGRLDRIMDRDERYAAMSLSRTFNTIFIPLLVISAGVLIVWRRAGKQGRITSKPVKERSDDL